MWKKVASGWVMKRGEEAFNVKAVSKPDGNVATKYPKGTERIS